jgi:hypothetical protein
MLSLSGWISQKNGSAWLAVAKSPNSLLSATATVNIDGEPAGRIFKNYTMVRRRVLAGMHLVTVDILYTDVRLWKTTLRSTRRIEVNIEPCTGSIIELDVHSQGGLLSPKLRTSWEISVETTTVTLFMLTNSGGTPRTELHLWKATKGR